MFDNIHFITKTLILTHSKKLNNQKSKGKL